MKIFRGIAPFALLATLFASVLAVGGCSSEEPTFVIEIKDHMFNPAELVVPAGQRIKLVVRNLDDTAEEFESGEFEVEKIIAGNSEATLFIGPLEAGTYDFYGEFHFETAQGQLTAE